MKARSTPTPAFNGRRNSSPSAAGEQLDREHILRVLHDGAQLKRAGHSHRDVIFLPGGSRQIIDARRMRQDLRFVEQRNRSDVRNHETGLHPGMLREERRQILRSDPDSSSDRSAVR